MTGHIARLLLEKQFGFIRADNELEYFFHCSAVRGEGIFEQLREGQAVTFDEGNSTKGPRAENVRVVG